MKPNSNPRKMKYKGDVNCVKTTGCQMQRSVQILSTDRSRNVSQRDGRYLVLSKEVESEYK